QSYYISDAILCDIVQNTYSSSTVEEQTRMYNKFYAARDADLQSRSMSAGPTPSIKAFIAMINNYTHSSVRLAVKMAGETNGSITSAPTFSKGITVFSLTLQMNTARKNVEPLKSWIEGYLYAGLGQYIENSRMTVVAQPDVRSNSNSVIVGSVTLLHTGSSADLEQKVWQQLDAALKGAVSDKSPNPASSYAIEPAGPFDGKNGMTDEDDMSKPDHQEDLPDEDFSDVEDIVNNLRNAASAQSKKIVVYLVPQLVHYLFQYNCSNMHLSMTIDPKNPPLYELDSIVLTVRAPVDHNKAVERSVFLWKSCWHFMPIAQIPGTMDRENLDVAAWFWNSERKLKPNASDTLETLIADHVACEAYLQEWALLEQNLVKVLDKLIGEGGWHL
ncbi:MAG: hypothetical protein Q9228_002902, partial [Teloschistes exilis]